MPPVKPVTDEELLGEVAVDMGFDLKHENATEGKMKVNTTEGANDKTIDDEDEVSSEEKPIKTSKKRGAGEAVAAPEKKKRTAAKAKVEVKAERATNVPKDDTTEEVAKEDTAKEDLLKKATPKKAVPKNATPKKATPAKAKATKANKNDDEGEEAVSNEKVDKVNSPKTPGGARKRTAAKSGSVAPARGIPASWEEATEADKMLVTMKENGTDWGTIRAAWKAETGLDSAGSSLPNRYARLKSAFQRLADGDEAKLLAAKEQVESKFELEKFALIADAMEKMGTEKYPTLFLQKKVKELAAGAKPKAAKGLENLGAGEVDDGVAE